MTTQSTAKKTIDASVSTATKAFADSAERAQDFNEKFAATIKQAGLLGLDNYEKSLATLLGFQKKAAGATGQEWLGSLVEAQADLVAGLSANATSAVREVLK